MKLIILLISMAHGSSYKTDALPVFKARCSQCHNASTPKINWLEYKTAKKHSDKIKTKLKDNTMPPGNATQITAEERTTVIKWVTDGAKK